jgi:hypothetical protein
MSLKKRGQHTIKLNSEYVNQKRNVTEWCYENFGSSFLTWSHDGHASEFYFSDRENAMHFKLVWG